MNDKHQIIADIIVSLVQEGKYQLTDLLLSRKPAGFWPTVRSMLPSTMSWSNDPQYYVNVWPKIKGYVEKTVSQQTDRITQPIQMPMLEQIETPKQSAPIPSDPVVIQTDAITRSELVHIINEILDSRIAELKEVVPVTANNLKIPPKPTDKQKRVYDKFATTIDRHLNELVKKECERLRMPLSEFLDAVLYSYFREPRLSYME